MKYIYLLNYSMRNHATYFTRAEDRGRGWCHFEVAHVSFRVKYPVIAIFLSKAGLSTRLLSS